MRYLCSQAKHVYCWLDDATDDNNILLKWWVHREASAVICISFGQI